MLWIDGGTCSKMCYISKVGIFQLPINFDIDLCRFYAAQVIYQC